MGEYHGCEDGIFCTHGLPELGDAGAKVAPDVALPLSRKDLAAIGQALEEFKPTFTADQLIDFMRMFWELTEDQQRAIVAEVMRGVRLPHQSCGANNE